MKNFRLVVVLMFACCPTLVRAQTLEFPETSGNTFVRLCSAIDKDKETAVEQAYDMACISYATGFLDGVGLATAVAEKTTKQTIPKAFCSGTIEKGQLVRITLKYIRNHPEKAQMATGILIMLAMEEAFPCPSK